LIDQSKRVAIEVLGALEIVGRELEVDDLVSHDILLHPNGAPF
jgi:hypothetical protein